MWRPLGPIWKKIRTILRTKSTNLRSTLFRHPRYIILAGVALIILLLALYLCLPAAGPGAQAISVRVASGAGTRAIARQLEQENVIRSADQFVVWARLLGAEGKLQAGFYSLPPSWSPPFIVLHIKNGSVANQGIIIPEGYNLQQIADALAQADLVDKESFMAMATDPKSLPELELDYPLPGPTLEGYLFPDTYKIAPGTPVHTILRMMLLRMQQVAWPLVEEAGLPAGFDFHKLLTLASLVEKEAQVAEERPLIAAVFLKRLRLGMPLQADPSVKYVMENPPTYLSLQDIAIDSPFNTYKYPGLPPGPIASPGKEAILAVLHPAATNYLYFVARGDGTHIFSSTYQEHLEARRYLKEQQ